MKTLTKKLKLVVLLMGIVILSSCSGRVNVGGTLGISVIYHHIPAMAITVTKYAEHKISGYLNNSSIAKNEKVNSGKKVEKKVSHNKVKPISIGIFREVRLV